MLITTLLDASSAPRCSPQARRGGIDKLIPGDHNSALKPTSLYDDMFVDNEIARASFKATPADETDHPSGLIRNFNLGSASHRYIR